MANASTAALVGFPVNIDDIERSHYPSAKLPAAQAAMRYATYVPSHVLPPTQNQGLTNSAGSTGRLS
jgi:hypothetical protein